MDVVTHALLGATVAVAAAPARLPMRGRLWLGAIAAALPDVDFAGFLIDPLRFLADWHQGPTHSLVLLPFWALLIGAAYARLCGPGALLPAALASALALASHIGADVITAYGTAVLYPLSDWRVGLGTTFVIDPLFSGIVLASLIAALRSGRRGVAAIGLAVLCLYVGGQSLLQRRAVELGHTAAAAQGLRIERLVALAQPFSPFNWKLIGSGATAHYEAHVNLTGHAPLVPALPGLRWLHEIAAAYRPAAEPSWRARHRFGAQPDQQALAQPLWHEPRFASFRRFALFPALSRIDRDPDATCVWFTDLRYDLPALPDTFRYGFCREQDSLPWQLYRLRYFSERSRQHLER